MPQFPTVMILAGGLGTRLGDVAATIPKAMMMVAGAPFIDHQLRLLRRENVRRVVLCVSHLRDQIEQHVKDGSDFGLEVRYSQDGASRLGTGGAVLKAANLVGDEFAVLYGDTYLDIDFNEAYQTFLKSGRGGLMTILANGNRWDKSNVLFRDGQVVAYDKHAPSPEMQHIDYGLLLFKRSTVSKFKSDEPFDLTDVIADLIGRQQLAGHEVFQRFYEIGTPESLAETERYLLNSATSSDSRSKS